MEVCSYFSYYSAAVTVTVQREPRKKYYSGKKKEDTHTQDCAVTPFGEGLAVIYTYEIFF